MAAPHDSSRQLLQEGVSQLHDLGMVGAQAMTRKGHRPSWAGAGHRSLHSPAPVPRNGYFRMGSNTKTFAAVVVLQLMEEGKLTLDDTVEDHLPGVVQGNGYDGTQVTVRQLLQHTSGIYNYTHDVAMFRSVEDYHRHRFDHFDPAELVAMALAREPVSPPGTKFDYSNTNYILAGMIIEELTGRSWVAEVQRRISEPLGLRQTASPGGWSFLPHPHAKGYQQFVEGGALVDTTYWNPTVAYAAGDVVTTPADLTRFWQALQRGELLGPRALAEMQTTVPADELAEYWPGAEYGLGVMWLPSSCGGYWSHNGDVPGMMTANGVTADGERATVISLNTQLADPEAFLALHHRVTQLIDDTLCR